MNLIVQIISLHLDELLDLLSKRLAKKNEMKYKITALAKYSALPTLILDAKIDESKGCKKPGDDRTVGRGY